jgi:hypothetical protein
MQRVVTVKRSVALAVAGLVVGTVGALSVPALASNTAGHRVANVPGFTLDFTGTNNEASVPDKVGSGFSGTARVKDGNGNVIGTAYDACDKDAISATADTVYCNALVKLNSGDQLTFAAAFPIPNAASEYPLTFDVPVTGGTGAYEGITGEAFVANRSVGVYDLSFH